jgi:uncharacterized membrane protein YjjB (DUF3815 family)
VFILPAIIKLTPGLFGAEALRRRVPGISVAGM